MTILNLYSANNIALKYIKQKLTERKKQKEEKKEINKFTIIVGDLSTTLSVTERTNRQEIDKNKEDLNNVINQLGLIYIEHYS